MPKPGYLYIMSNRNRTTLYIGVTSDLARRVAEHKTGAIEGFTKRYNLHELVYLEYFPDIREAIERETIVKKWGRVKKEELIRVLNPEMKDLSISH